MTKDIYRERRKYYRGISLNHLLIKSSYLNNNSYSTIKQDRDYNQIILWYNLIEYELKNKQNLTVNRFLSRIEYTFKKAMMVIRNYPDIWLMYIDFKKKYYIKEPQWRNILPVYQQACKTLPKCLFLHLEYCEYLELNKNIIPKEIESPNNYYTQLLNTIDNILIKIHGNNHNKINIENLEKHKQYSLVFISYLHYKLRNEGLFYIYIHTKCHNVASWYKYSHFMI